MGQEEQLNKPFQVTSVCRTDLIRVYTDRGLSEEEAIKEVLKFTDEEMVSVASSMADSYCETNGFWDSLSVLAEIFDKERK